MRERKIFISTLILFVFLITIGFNSLAFNEQINYQGKLMDKQGGPVSDGGKCLKFRLMDAETGGNEIWSEGWTTSTEMVTTTKGLFSVMLGKYNSLSNVNFNQVLYLEVQFDPGCDGTYEEIFLPRKPIGASVAAFEAKKLLGYDWASPGILGATNPNEANFTKLTVSATSTLSTTTISGLFAVNNNLFYVDPINSRIGIATSTPNYKLDVAGNLRTTDYLRSDTGLCIGDSCITSWGSAVNYWTLNDSYLSPNNLSWNVGIGTSTPAEKLTVEGNILATGNLIVPQITTLAGNLTLNPAGSVLISKSTSISGNLSVSGTATTSQLFVTSTSTLGTVISGVWQGSVIQTNFGGTGLSTIGSSNQILGVKSDGTALEYKNISSLLSAGSGISISGGAIATISNAGVLSINSATGTLTLQGTTNQINVSTNSGVITLSLPQDIATTSSPTFSNLTLSSLTPGSVLFANSSGLISQDNANFYWDNTNKRLGIGTSSPAYTLTVNGTLFSSATSTFMGNVGIGTTTPPYLLTVGNSLLTVSQSSEGALNFARVSIGGSSARDQLFVYGRINSSWWNIFLDDLSRCRITTLTADTPDVCGLFFDEDTDGGLEFPTGVDACARLRASTAGSLAVGEGAIYGSAGPRDKIQVSTNPVFEAEVMAENTTNVRYHVGFDNYAVGANVDAEPTDGIYFRAVNSSVWTAVARAGGTETAVNTSLSTTVWRKLRIEVYNTSPPVAKFFIGGQEVATISTNIPTNTPLGYHFGVALITTADSVKYLKIRSLRIWADDPNNLEKLERANDLNTKKTEEFNAIEDSDIAEWYLVDDINKFPDGAVVSLDSSVPGKVNLSSIPYDPKVLGVKSTYSTITIGRDNGNAIPVSLAGRILVKVSNINGQINPGDLLTSSNIPGVAMKATEPGRVIGMALESSEKCNREELERGECKILMFVNLHWSLGSIAENGNFTTNDSTTNDQQRTILDQFTLGIKRVLEKLGLLIENGVAKIEKIFAKEIVVERIKSEEIETTRIKIKDKATGEIYCLWIENGEIRKEKENCEVLISQPKTDNLQQKTDNLQETTDNLQQNSKDQNQTSTDQKPRSDLEESSSRSDLGEEINGGVIEQSNSENVQESQ